MSLKWFRIIGALLIIALLGITGWGVAAGNSVIPIAAVIGGMAILFLLRRQVTDTLEDERNYRLSEKASRFTFRAFAVAAGISGVVLIAMSKDDSSRLSDIGMTLAFCVCAMLLLYMTSYVYYSRKN